MTLVRPAAPQRGSFVRAAPAGMPDDLRDLAFATAPARAGREPRPALLIEQDHLVVQGDVALRPAKHLDRGCQLAARLERERFDPAEDLDGFGGDPTVVLPPSRHAR